VRSTRIMGPKTANQGPRLAYHARYDTRQHRPL